MSDPEATAPGHGFGTMPVFLAAISTILGAILFLRFGYAVGNVGLLGALAIILLGHLVTVPTALAIAEIATNRKVEGGGEYFIISRSFGATIGSVIGLALYVSQAVSVGFYLIALAEALKPVAPLIEQWVGVPFDARMVSVPAGMLLLFVTWLRGAGGGVALLYVVCATLFVALGAFFLGQPVAGMETSSLQLGSRISDADGFFVVFAICFPAFTGMTAGVGLSGDLANPRRSIPAGTLAATVTGMVVYVAIAVKLALSAPPEALAGDQFVMARIAVWGPLIYIGLGAACLSSAIGSVLVAPRTLQALAGDSTLPLGKANAALAAGHGAHNEPRNATLVTGLIAMTVIGLGDVNAVARLISMFFMVTYGALCAISFLEHFAARPSYRPSFRSRWYVSLFGAGICLLMMFQMDPVFAILSLVAMTGLYALVVRGREDGGDDLAQMFAGVLSQATRYLQIRLQRRRESELEPQEWRPSVLAVGSHTFERRSPLELLEWLCHRQGFGTYLHFIEGRLNEDSYDESQKVKQRLLKLARGRGAAVYMDTIVSPSLISALAQALQIPGVSGLPNNTVLFELSVDAPTAELGTLVSGARFAASTRRSLLVLRHGQYYFGDRRNIHIWLTWNDEDNANLMILLGYILVGHKTWADAEISVFAAMPASDVVEQRARFDVLIADGRIPISHKNITFLAINDVETFRSAVVERSEDADLVIMGFDMEGLSDRAEALFLNHPTLRDVLFVHAPQAIELG